MFLKIDDSPTIQGRFGDFGGRFVPELLMPALLQLEKSYEEARTDPQFILQYQALLRDVVGRPSLLTHATRLSNHTGAEIYLKREDLNHTGAHKINNTMGQALLCQRMGKRRVIAETGAGQHGVATATACALFGFECIIYMGAADVERQSLNVERMKLLGATVIPVTSGTKTLKDAMNAAMRDWVGAIDETYYMVGSAAGPHPYPMLVRDLQRVIGDEARVQIRAAMGGLPDVAIACVGGGSNAIGLFQTFLDPQGAEFEAADDTSTVKLIGVEAAGEGLDTLNHSASLNCGRVGVLHGAATYLLQNDDGQVLPPHSIAPGLDYPAVGPQHSFLQASGRASYMAVGDQEAVAALRLLAKTEGILCALESAHAVAGALRYAKEHPQSTILVCLSGRGDKDMPVLSALPY